MAKNPFLSAHDSLVGLFEETSRKVHFDLSKQRLFGRQLFDMC